ncbi:hypothetical protein [Mesorhizobium sp. M0029]
MRAEIVHISLNLIETAELDGYAGCGHADQLTIEVCQPPSAAGTEKAK